MLGAETFTVLTVAVVVFPSLFMCAPMLLACFCPCRSCFSAEGAWCCAKYAILTVVVMSALFAVAIVAGVLAE